VAVELDENALIDCEKNFLNSRWSERLSVVKVKMDFLEFESNVKFSSNRSFCNFKSQLMGPFFENGVLKNEQW
jgi:tRNA1(Val) A37 N6-methylase TrmN6